MKLHKDDFCKAFAARRGISIPEAKETLADVFKTVKEEFQADLTPNSEIRFSPFGKFVLKHTPAQENVQVANRYVNIEEQYRIDFKPFKDFKIK
jgi:nucleoid DNA-binding protein